MAVIEHPNADTNDQRGAVAMELDREDNREGGMYVEQGPMVGVTVEGGGEV